MMQVLHPLNMILQIHTNHFGKICGSVFAALAVPHKNKTLPKINILNAALSAMAQAVTTLSKNPNWVLVDGNQKPNISVPCSAIIAGDSKSISIACASIIAKVV